VETAASLDAFWLASAHRGRCDGVWSVKGVLDLVSADPDC
jgi:hypothetical protein